MWLQRPPLDISFRSLTGNSNYRGHQNIFLEGNLIRSASGPAASISNVDGLVLSGNVFETPSAGPPVVISNTKIHCMLNNSGEDTFQLDNVDFTAGLSRVDYQAGPQVYPNPAGPVIYVKPGASMPGMPGWHIHDLNGAALASGRLSAKGHDQAIDISGLKTGMYLMELKDWRTVQRLKFLKE